MITTKTCYLLTCDGCGDDFESEYVPHFDSEQAALEYLTAPHGDPALAGVAIDGKHYCSACRCKAEDHVVTTHKGDTELLRCDRCGEPV